MHIRTEGIEEKAIQGNVPHSFNGFAEEEQVLSHKDRVHVGTAHDAAENGQAATDK